MASPSAGSTQQGRSRGLAHLQTAERCQDIYPATVFVTQRQRLPIEPKQDVTASPHYMLDTGGVGVGSVAQNKISLLDG